MYHCDRLAQPGVERVARRPSELAADLRRVDRVAPIVARAIGHERLQSGMRRILRPQLVERVADPIDDLEVGALVAAADIVLSAGDAVRQHEQQTGAVILDVQPVADVAAVAVDRQRPCRRAR